MINPVTRAIVTRTISMPVGFRKINFAGVISRLLGSVRIWRIYFENGKEPIIVTTIVIIHLINRQRSSSKCSKNVISQRLLLFFLRFLVVIYALRIIFAGILLRYFNITIWKDKNKANFSAGRIIGRLPQQEGVNCLTVPSLAHNLSCGLTTAKPC